MPIPFTQFLMPDGRRTHVEIDRPPEIEAKAHSLIQCGCRFEIEMLRTGQISMTVERGEDETLAIEVCPNGPDVPVCVDRIVVNAGSMLLTLTEAIEDLLPEPEES